MLWNALLGLRRQSVPAFCYTSDVDQLALVLKLVEYQFSECPRGIILEINEIWS